MTYQPNPNANSYKNVPQNDKQIYVDFQEQQKRLREAYAGAASKNNVSTYHYGPQQEGFKKYKDVSQEYMPHQNRNNVYERQINQADIPKTRDRYIKNAFAQMIQPKIVDHKQIANNHYKTDKLDISDIPGTNVNTHGNKKMIQGRNYMDLSDIDKTSPNQLKQNRITNIPDYMIDTKDIDSPGKNKFTTNRVTDPLNPQYKLETKSRRHVLLVGEIEGNQPKIQKSTVTRRHTNYIDDIKGSKTKEGSSIPKAAKEKLTQYEPPKMGRYGPLQPIAEYGNPAQNLKSQGSYGQQNQEQNKYPNLTRMGINTQSQVNVSHNNLKNGMQPIPESRSAIQYDVFPTRHFGRREENNQNNNQPTSSYGNYQQQEDTGSKRINIGASRRMINNTQEAGYSSPKSQQALIQEILNPQKVDSYQKKPYKAPDLYTRQYRREEVESRRVQQNPYLNMIEKPNYQNVNTQNSQQPAGRSNKPPLAAQYQQNRIMI